MALEGLFSYFAALPEDDEIAFDEILWAWIGEGLVPGNGGDDPRVDAFSLLNKLLRRSFMESNGEVSDEEGLLWFKVHDVMRDLAFYVLENDSGTPLAKQLLSLWRRSKFGKKSPKSGKQYPKL